MASKVSAFGQPGKRNEFAQKKMLIVLLSAVQLRYYGRWIVYFKTRNFTMVSRIPEFFNPKSLNHVIENLKATCKRSVWIELVKFTKLDSAHAAKRQVLDKFSSSNGSDKYFTWQTRLIISVFPWLESYYMVPMIHFSCLICSSGYLFLDTSVHCTEVTARAFVITQAKVKSLVTRSTEKKRCHEYNSAQTHWHHA